MWPVILIALASSLAINLILFAVAFKRQSDKLTDISYALSFLTVDIVSLVYAKNHDAFSWILFMMIALWALRIGSFLLYRVIKVGKDRRFDGMRESFVRFGKFWLGQAITAWVLMLPALIAQYGGGSLSPLAYSGLLLWSVGLVVEALADSQKFAFRQDPANKGRWIHSGVWRYSRHPNYFGEILVWVSVYMYSFGALDGIQKLVGLASPVLITAVLLFVSGVPILEKSADERWGKLEAYRRYKRETRLLIPLPRIGNH